MDDLIEFLRARLDEDEAVADAASGGEWGAIDHTRPFTIFDVAAYRKNKGRGLTGRYAVGAIERPEDRTHIARHDPARVLREVEAKRRMLALHAPNERDKEQCVVCDYGTDSCGCMGMNGGWPCETIAILALPYASHPDYRPGWAPSA